MLTELLLYPASSLHEQYTFHQSPWMAGTWEFRYHWKQTLLSIRDKAFNMGCPHRPRFRPGGLVSVTLDIFQMQSKRTFTNAGYNNSRNYISTISVAQHDTKTHCTHCTKHNHLTYYSSDGWRSSPTRRAVPDLGWLDLSCCMVVVQLDAIRLDRV